jgi:hypothetical protein
MNKFTRIILLATVLLTLVVSPAMSAEQGPPVGLCPPPFELHSFMDHAEHHEHHIGIEVDLNQDGYNCVKHLSNGLHVHMDNVVLP